MSLSEFLRSQISWYQPTAWYFKHVLLQSQKEAETWFEFRRPGLRYAFKLLTGLRGSCRHCMWEQNPKPNVHKLLDSTVEKHKLFAHIKKRGSFFLYSSSLQISSVCAGGVCGIALVHAENSEVNRNLTELAMLYLPPEGPVPGPSLRCEQHFAVAASASHLLLPAPPLCSSPRLWIPASCCRGWRCCHGLWKCRCCTFWVPLRSGMKPAEQKTRLLCQA